ncbi:MAG: PaeR7I family type II restriction endonuclease, partial [Phycisphaerales bacterium]
MQENRTLKDLTTRMREAVAHYWRTRSAQRHKQQQTGKLDQGSRGAVTGGAQMDGFIRLFTDLICDAGIARECLHCEKSLELPGFFRPTKE